MFQEWIITIGHWGLILLKLPMLIPLHILSLLLFGRIPHTEFYDHLILPQQVVNGNLCGYCGVILTKSNKQMHAYQGNHKWWCFLKRAGRNELITSSWQGDKECRES